MPCDAHTGILGHRQYYSADGAGISRMEDLVGWIDDAIMDAGGVIGPEKHTLLFPEPYALDAVLRDGRKLISASGHPDGDAAQIVRTVSATFQHCLIEQNAELRARAADGEASDDDGDDGDAEDERARPPSRAKLLQALRVQFGAGTQLAQQFNERHSALAVAAPVLFATCVWNAIASALWRPMATRADRGGRYSAMLPLIDCALGECATLCGGNVAVWWLRKARTLPYALPFDGASAARLRTHLGFHGTHADAREALLLFHCCALPLFCLSTCYPRPGGSSHCGSAAGTLQFAEALGAAWATTAQDPQRCLPRRAAAGAGGYESDEGAADPPPAAAPGEYARRYDRGAALFWTQEWTENARSWARTCFPPRERYSTADAVEQPRSLAAAAAPPLSPAPAAPPPTPASSTATACDLASSPSSSSVCCEDDDAVACAAALEAGDYSMIFALEPRIRAMERTADKWFVCDTGDASQGITFAFYTSAALATAP
jgi:hypothetical protein